MKKRILEPNPVALRAEASTWYEARAIETSTFINSIDTAMAQEANEYNSRLQKHGQEIISALPVKMGGGGNCVLLYFLARHLKPSVIVETGVSMGFSSHAFLSAIGRNNKGYLYSSDFPYFRLPEPEKYIGCVVEDSLKKDWTLLIEGDHKNLTKIAEQVDSIQLLHYDSDKSYAGRSEALKILGKKLKGATVVFDDIGDNFHFRDFIEKNDQPSIILKNPMGGFVGLTGDWISKSK